MVLGGIIRRPLRRRKAPAAVRAALDLRTGEQVLAVASSGDEDYLVATSSALCIISPVPGDPGGGFELGLRIRWDEIDRARWAAPALELVFRGTGPETSDALQRATIPVDPDADLPAFVRDRVSDSIILSEEIQVTGGAARVVARRHGDTGEIIWRVSMGTGVDPEDPVVQQQVSQGIAELRSGLGV